MFLVDSHIDSAQNENYRPDETDKEFDNLLRNRGCISIGTFFHYCKFLPVAVAHVAPQKEKSHFSGGSLSVGDVLRLSSNENVTAIKVIITHEHIARVVREVKVIAQIIGHIVEHVVNNGRHDVTVFLEHLAAIHLERCTRVQVGNGFNTIKT